MKIQIVLLVFALGISAHAEKFQFEEVPLQKSAPTQADVAPPSPPVATVSRADEQKPVPGQKVLITTEQSRLVIEKFKEAYLKLGSPRMMIYVNRDLAEGSKGKASDSKTDSDIEQLFGQPLRAAEAKLADQKMANKMMAGKILKAPTQAGDAKAASDRDDLRKIADVAIEILVSSKEVKVTEDSGGKTISVPSVQATAIRLEDAHIIGMASNADLQGRERGFDVHDVGEAVALSLMEDMVKEVK